MTYSPNFRGTTARGSARSDQTRYENGTGLTMTKASPVSTDTSGNLILVDVSVEATVRRMVGLTAESIAPAVLGQVCSDGRLENIPGGLGFAIGDTIWVAPSGTLTNVKPDLSVFGWASGYWVIFVGVVVENEFNALQQDLQLQRQVIGQL